MKRDPPASQLGDHLPLCDLGFGPLACFVTLKPLSSCNAVAHVGAGHADSMELENSDDAGVNVQEIRIQDVDDRCTTINVPDIAQQPKQRQHLADYDSPSLQSFSSGGSSPSSARRRLRLRHLGVPARHLTGEITGKADCKDVSKMLPREHASWKHENPKAHVHVTGNDELDRQLLLDAWQSCRLVEAGLVIIVQTPVRYAQILLQLVVTVSFSRKDSEF